MDINERIQAEMAARKVQDAEAQARREQKAKKDAAHEAWQRAGDRIGPCYDSPKKSIPAALKAIHAALHASEAAGELGAIRSVATFWLEHESNFSLAAHVAATIVNAVEAPEAEELIRSARDLRILSELADCIESIGEIAWHGFDLNKYYAHILAPVSAAREQNIPNGAATTKREATPSWDRNQRVLSFNGAAVKKYKRPADNQYAILDAFQELGWPAEMDDPLPSKVDVESTPEDRRRDTVKSLNDGHETDLLQFYVSGSRVGWRRIT